MKPSTDQLHNVAVQGPAQPRAPEADRVDAADADLARGSRSGSASRSGASATYDGIPIVVSRTGYTGELGYEVWCHPSDGPAVWDAIWAAGEAHGLTPLGLEALDILRIEAGLIFAGYEFDDQVDPFEAGIGFAVDLEDGRRLRRPRGARGAACAPAARARGARARGQRDRGPRRRGLRRPPAGRRRHERDAQPDPEEEHRARRESRCSTPSIGTALEVGKLDGLQKRIPATVVRFPFYDPEKTRPRS